MQDIIEAKENILDCVQAKVMRGKAMFQERAWHGREEHRLSMQGEVLVEIQWLEKGVICSVIFQTQFP